MASVALVILALGILGIGAMNTKRYKLRERYTRRPFGAGLASMVSLYQEHDVCLESKYSLDDLVLLQVDMRYHISARVEEIANKVLGPLENLFRSIGLLMGMHL